MQTSLLLVFHHQGIHFTGVLILNIELTSTLVAFPSVPLGFSFGLVERWPFNVDVTNDSLLVQPIQLSPVLFADIEICSIRPEIFSSFLKIH